MGFACKVYVLNLQVAHLSSTAGGDVAAARGETTSLDNLFKSRQMCPNQKQNVFVCVFGGSTVLRACVRVVAERIEHETARVAKTLCPSQSRNNNAEELAEPEYFKDGMYSGLKIHGVSPRRILVRCFSDFSTDTDFLHGENGAAGVPTFGSRSGPIGTKLVHVQFNSSRSNFTQRMSLDLRRYHPYCVGN